MSPKEIDYMEWECSRGHKLAANTAIVRCPAVVRGSPCTGELTRVGVGSRKANAK